MTFPIDRRRVAVSGEQMAYADVGEGRPVVLLHGFPTSADLWRREIWLLAQRMRVIAPDLIGYGESEKRDGVDLSEPAQAGYVRELLAQLGIEEAAVVGHDIGGAVALMLALDRGLRVSALVLVDAACFDAWPTESVQMIQGVAPEQETPRVVEDIVRAAFILGVTHQHLLHEEDVAAYLRPWLEDPGAFFRAARALTGKGLAGRELELGDLDLPVLIMWGEADPFLPAALAERLGEAIPGSTVALLPGCSHYLTEDAPQTVGPLIHEYLRSRYLGESHGHPTDGPVRVFLERPPDHLA